MHIKLESLNKKIIFIDNPVLHTGLEPSEVFLEKTKNALKNLLALIEVEGEEATKRKVKLVKLYLLLANLKLSHLLQNALYRRIRKIEKNLTSCRPSLFQFNLYRLYHLFQQANSVQRKEW
jgi:hypothetical protein